MSEKTNDIKKHNPGISIDTNFKALGEATAEYDPWRALLFSVFYRAVLDWLKANCEIKKYEVNIERCSKSSRYQKLKDRLRECEYYFENNCPMPGLTLNDIIGRLEEMCKNCNYVYKDVMKVINNGYDILNEPIIEKPKTKNKQVNKIIAYDRNKEYTVAEIAAFYNVSQSTVSKWIVRKNLKCRKELHGKNHRYFIKPCDVEELLKVENERKEIRIAKNKFDIEALEKKDIFTIQEACAYAKISKNTIYRRIYDGKLEVKTEGKRYFIEKSELERMINNRKAAC